MECATPARGSAFRLKTGHKIPKTANKYKKLYFEDKFNPNSAPVCFLTKIQAFFTNSKRIDKQTNRQIFLLFCE